MPKSIILPRICANCGSLFQVHPCEVARGRGRFCSHTCAAHCQPTIPVEDRFWDRVDKTSHPGGCWVWTGARSSFGYGSLRDRGATVRAHRVSWELHYGAIPDDLWVLHKCDNPPCVNPDHLFLGTLLDNSRDMVQKGRSTKGLLVGEKNPRSRLTPDDVRAIRAMRKTGARVVDVASHFGVCERTVKGICRREFWKHIE